MKFPEYEISRISNSQSMTYTRHKEREDKSAMGSASLFPDCPIARPRCVW